MSGCSRFVYQPNEQFLWHGGSGVGLAVKAAELDFIDLRGDLFDNRPDLSLAQAFLREALSKRYHLQ